MLSYAEIMEMENRDIRTIRPEELVDIRTVKIDPKLPKEEKIKSYIEQVKYPNVFRVGKVVVKTSYANNGRTLDDAVKSYLQSCARL